MILTASKQLLSMWEKGESYPFTDNITRLLAALYSGSLEATVGGEIVVHSLSVFLSSEVESLVRNEESRKERFAL